MRPYERLADAIVIQAAKDYRKANMKLARSRNNKEAQRIHDECLRFIRSEWFGILTRLEPELLIEKLDKEAKNDSQGIS